MTTELATVPQQRTAALQLSSDQTWWDNRQLAALRQMGVDQASDGDLLVFLHVSQKTGLDPFARQIYMIGRNTKNPRTNQWEVKQTIQTGIDGYRLIADRADRRDGTSRSYDDTLWADAEGTWTDLWTKATAPTAAKVTVYRGDRKFSAVAMYREYVQTNRQGEPNPMWSRMPANQLAKCAEALALRKAYPQDLSGIYTDDEMGPADAAATVRQVPAADQGNGAQRMAAVLDGPGSAGPEPTPEHPIVDVEPEPGDDPSQPSAGEESPRLDMRSTLARQLFAVLNEAAIPDDRQHEYLSKTLSREITSRKDLTEADAQHVIRLTRDILDNNHPGAASAGQPEDSQ